MCSTAVIYSHHHNSMIYYYRCIDLVFFFFGSTYYVHTTHSQRFKTMVFPLNKLIESYTKVNQSAWSIRLIFCLFWFSLLSTFSFFHWKEIFFFICSVSFTHTCTTSIAYHSPCDCTYLPKQKKIPFLFSSSGQRQQAASR